MSCRIRSHRITQLLVFGVLLGAGVVGAASPAARSTAENPQWPRHAIAEGYMNQTAIAADFTGDGRVDVISNGDGKTRLYVAPDWKEVIIDDSEERRGLIHSEVMDVDGDGDPDFIGAVYRRPIFWLERPDNPLKGPWPYHLIDDQVDGTHGLIAGDVNRDGRHDLIGNSAQPEGPFPNSLAWFEIPENPRQA